jgi:uncharacterized protein YhaN
MMRLRRLDLTRFGHFTNHSLDLGPARTGAPDFHIIYGPNEAGKTTLMEAYLRLIYGFPMRDGYGFKHPLNTLQVGGVLEIDGRATELVRVKKNANSLLDSHGDPVPETALQACLGGIGQDDYRKLFCLDDATIEAGGDEITNSKGDIGKLLFSAAAGISDLSGVLDQVSARAEAFYKKSASKTAFAGLKRDLDAVLSDIKGLDISASLYHSLQTTLETAIAAEHSARAAKDAHARRLTELAALIAAHPIAATLRAAEADLAPIAHYPAALDIDPEALVQLMNARVVLDATLAHEAQAMAEADAALADLPLSPEILAKAHDIQTLEASLGRMEGAEADLPTRISERAAALSDMRAKLAGTGLPAGDDPTRFVLPDPVLARLDRALSALRAAETALATTKTEQRRAETTLQTSAAELQAAQTAVTIPPAVTEVLTHFGAAQVVEDNRAAQIRLTQARATAANRLRDLARGGISFATLPAAPLTLRQADDLTTALARSDQQLASLHDALTTTQDKADRAAARLAVLSSPDLVTDTIASAQRSTRDVLWATHRAALTAPTADAFAEALHRDDAATALRLAQSRDLAALTQARLAQTEALADHATARIRLDQASAAHTTLHATRSAALAAIGLPDLPAADLADWLRQHAAARDAEHDLHSAETLTAPARQAATALHAALSALPDLAGHDLETAYRLALAQSQTRSAQLIALQTAQEAHAKDAAALAARIADAETAQSACTAAAAHWQAEASAALPQGTPLTHLPDALPALRGLREINETVTGLTRQIDGMTRDRDGFVTRLTALLPEPPADALAAFRALRAALTRAETAARTHAELTARRNAAETAHRTAAAGLATQDAQIRQLGQAFAPSIATATLPELRAAVTTAQTAITLRATIAAQTTALLTRLATPDRAQADAILAAHPLTMAESEQAQLTQDSAALAAAVDAAIIARTKAQEALSRVTGDADVATRVARQRTLEVEMQDGTLRYLEDRLSLMLAERALRRYRDSHRGGMLVATETAFRTLTNGAYASLTTQAEGQTEALVAIQSAGGAAKQAREMSKGTKFQLYLALRAAAYEQVAAGGTVLPFFCDDIFETFDEGRTTAACGLLSQIGQRGQAIYLTHHKHVVDIARALCGDAVQVHQVTG